MRTLITTILSLAVGVFAASAIAWLIGRLWPAAQTPVFWVLAISWLWAWLALPPLREIVANCDLIL